MTRSPPVWTTACPDWAERIVAGRSLLPVGPLFEEPAAAAREVFDGLCVADAGGFPIAQLSRPWLLDWVSAIFGAYDADTGVQLIQEFLLLISKKNMKSTGAAGVMLTALTRNWRDEAEFLVLAPTIEIANNSFGPARSMIRLDEELADLYYVQEHTRTITHRVNGAQLKIVAADSEAVSGKKATGIFVDELWLFGKNPKAQNMLLEATGGLTSRPEGFVIYATTMSDEPLAGVMAEKVAYARGVRDGSIVDPQFLPLLYEFPKRMLEAEAHKDPKNFYVTNPNLGASVREDYLKRQYAVAQTTGDEAVQRFLAKHANVEVGVALHVQRWRGADFWEKQARPMTLADIIAESEVLVAGIDGGGLDDLLGLAIMGRSKITRRWLHWAHAWMHPIVLKRRQTEASFFRDLEAAGELTIIENLPGDVSQVADKVVEVQRSGKLWGIGQDPEKTHKVMLTELERRKIDPKTIWAVPQGWKLVGAITLAERALAEGTLEHCGQKLMAYSVGNARGVPRGNAFLITKEVSGTSKIDPLMATFNCVELLSRNPEAAPDVASWLNNVVIA